MPNSHYYKARAKWASGQINWAADDVRAVLTSSAYVPQLAVDEFLSTVLSGWRVGNPAILAGKVVEADGRCRATSPLTCTGMPGSGSANGLVFFKYSGNEATSPLLMYWHEAVTGLPVTLGAGIQNVRIAFPTVGLFVL